MDLSVEMVLSRPSYLVIILKNISVKRFTIQSTKIFPLEINSLYGIIVSTEIQLHSYALLMCSIVINLFLRDFLTLRLTGLY